LDRGGDGAETAPGDGCPWQRDHFKLRKEGPVTVFDEGQGEGGGEEVEVGVVSGEGDQDHQGEETEGGGEASFGLGKEKGKGQKEFDPKGEKGGELEKGMRELMNEPGEGIGNGLGFEVIGHGGKISPGGVATEKFYESRTKHEACEKEPESPADETRRGIGTGGAGKKSGFFQEDEEKAGLEEKSVPLEREEVLADVYEGEPAEP